MLGSNGAGKTTTLAHPRRAAAARRRARSVSAAPTSPGCRAHEIAALGLALVPEGRQLFPEHTVRENLELGAYRHLRRGERERVRQASSNEVFELFPARARAPATSRPAC